MTINEMITLKNGSKIYDLKKDRVMTYERPFIDRNGVHSCILSCNGKKYKAEYCALNGGRFALAVEDRHGYYVGVHETFKLLWKGGRVYKLEGAKKAVRITF